MAGKTVEALIRLPVGGGMGGSGVGGGQPAESSGGGSLAGNMMEITLLLLTSPSPPTPTPSPTPTPQPRLFKTPQVPEKLPALFAE